MVPLNVDSSDGWAATTFADNKQNTSIYFCHIKNVAHHSVIQICKEKADLISFTSSSSLLLTKSLICWNKILNYGTVIRINYCLQKLEDFRNKEKLKVNLRNHDETVHEAWGHAAEARISDKFFNFFKPSVDFIVCEIGVKITHIPSAEMVHWYNYLRNLSYLLEAGRHLMNVVISDKQVYLLVCFVLLLLLYFINLSLIWIIMNILLMNEKELLSSTTSQKVYTISIL